MFTLAEILGSSSKHPRQVKPSYSQKPESKPQVSSFPPPSGPRLPSRRATRKAAGTSATKLSMSEQPTEPGSTGSLDQPVEPAASSGHSLLPATPPDGEYPPNLEDSFPNELPAAREVLPDEILNLSRTPVPVVDDQPSILIGVSGITSSGKTTLAHLLFSIVPPTTPVFLIHQDDFLVPKHLLVPLRNGGYDADGINAIDFASLKRVLRYSKREGNLPSTFRTMQAEEDERMHAVSLVSQDELDDLKAMVTRSGLFQAGRPNGIVDGSLLYHDPTIRSLFDVKVVLRASRESSRRRRFEKPEYLGSEPGDDYWRTREYFDRVIWPNYTEEHGPLFEDGDVQGRPIVGLCEQLGIVIQPEIDLSVPEALKWAAESILKDISDKQFRKTRDDGLRSQEYQICNCDHGWLGKIRQTLFDLL